MSIQILIDMNLSPDWGDERAARGWPSVHWCTTGDPRATDREIMDWARINGYVVFTHDLDFGTMLALTVWLHRLLKAVAGCMTADSLTGPLACRYGEDEGFWEVNVYPTPVELVGGAVDGEVVAPGFALDVEELRAAFDRIEALMWYSLGFPHDEGPRVVVEGVYQGREVFLQLLAYAPEDEEPGMKLNTTRPKTA